MSSNNFVVGSGESDYSQEEYEQFEKAILMLINVKKIGQLDNATLGKKQQVLQIKVILLLTFVYNGIKWYGNDTILYYR